MSTVAAPPEQRVVLHDVSWVTYERLLAERGDDSVPRFTYDRGVLEIMSPGTPHERLDILVVHMVGALAEGWGVDVAGLGHLTYRHPEWERGFEPDGCFYVRDVAAIRGRTEVDAQVDPPPDVVVEIDISRSSIRKLGIFAQFGVPEVWRHDGDRATILVLDEGEYRDVEAGTAFPLLTADAMTRILAAGAETPLPRWLADTRAWATAAARS